MTMPQLPLDGITVVSFEQAVAAPFATRQLADLGARVIKVERPDGGDFARGYDRAVDGLASYFVWLNRSKESLAVDLKRAEGLEIAHALVHASDVFVQNLAPGAVERLGLSAGTIRANDPGKIYCSISGYGEDGPWAERKAYDMLVQAETGLVSVTGNRSGLARSGISLADIAAGMYAYSGVLAALVRKSRTGSGSTIEVSLFDALTEWMSQPAYFAAYSGSQPLAIGVEHATICPYAAYSTNDGAGILLAVQNEREWGRLCSHLLGDPSLAMDPRFSDNAVRVQHREVVNGLISDRLSQLTYAQAAALLDRIGIANGKVNSVLEAVEHPVLTERDRRREVATERGPITATLPPGLPIDIEARMDAVPTLGEHSRSLLRELGKSESEITRLIELGVITSPTPGLHTPRSVAH